MNEIAGKQKRGKPLARPTERRRVLQNPGPGMQALVQLRTTFTRAHIE